MLTSISCFLPMPSSVHLGSPTADHELFGHEAVFCSGFTVLSTAEPQRQVYGWLLVKKNLSAARSMGLAGSLNAFPQGWIPAGWEPHRVQPQNLFMIHQPQGSNFNPSTKGTQGCVVIPGLVRVTHREEVDTCLGNFSFLFYFWGLFSMLFVISLKSVCTAFIFSLVMKESTLKDFLLDF